MQENLSELARKYQEEMLRMYGRRQQSETPAENFIEDQPKPGSPETPPEPPADLPEPDEQASEPEPEDLGDPELPQYIRPVPPQLPEEWTAQQEYEDRNTAEGYLRIITAAADSAYPVPGARVSVFTTIGKRSHLSYLLLTDGNGETPTVSLPAPPAGLSQEPENVRPYASCDIRIAAKGFFRTQATDVHIFAGVTTRQLFQLVPLPLNMEASDADIDPNEIGRMEDCQGGAEC